MYKAIGLVLLLFVHTAVQAQNPPPPPTNLRDIRYSYAELRYLDYDNGGDGFRLNGSWDLGNNWIIVGGLTGADFDNSVDVTTFEVGGGYIWHYTPDWDLLATGRIVRSEVDTSSGSSNDTGFALSGGVRGFLADKFELRGSINYINVDDADAFLEIAGDYYFTRQISAGISLEFAGDNDLISIGGRYFFK
jgi:hypothetical protein